MPGPSFVAISIAPPTFLQAQDEEHGLAEVASAFEERGFSSTVRRVRTRDEIDTVARSVHFEGASVRVVLVSGHGVSFRLPGREEPFSTLLAEDADRANQAHTGVDVAGLVGKLRAGNAELLVVVDACEVDIPPTRDSRVSTAVLLASPADAAYTRRDGRSGVLTLALTRELRSSPDGEPWKDLLDRVRYRVEAETNGKQVPVVRILGSDEILRSRVPTVVGAPVKGPAVHDMLLDVLRAPDLPVGVIDAISSYVDSAGVHGFSAEIQAALLAQRIRPPAKPDSHDVRRLHRLLTGTDGISIEARVEALHKLGWALCQSGEFDQAAAWLEQALRDPALERATVLRPVMARIMDTLGTARLALGAFDRASELYRRSMDLKKAYDDALGLEMSRQNLGWSLLARGRFADGERVFEEGLDDCLHRLECPSHGRVQNLVQTLESTLVHLVGLCTVRLLTGVGSREFRNLETSCKRWMKLYRQLADWGAAGLLAEAEQLLQVGVDLFSAEREPVEGDRELVLLWKRVAASAGGGSACFQELVTSIRAQLPTAAPFMRLSFLAAAQVLVRGRIAQSSELRDEIVRFLRDVGMDGIPDPASPPWTVAPRLHLDASGWSTWGPMQWQVQETLTPNAWIDHTVPEKYLQVASWITGLFLCLEANLAERALEFVDRGNNEGGVVRLGFGQMLQFCRHSATAALNAGGLADFAAETAEQWSGKGIPSTGGYVALEDLVRERNGTTHVRVRTNEEIANSVRNLVRVADAASDLLARWNVSLEAGEGELGGGLRSAVLGSGRKRFDCGPLLLVDPARLLVTFVPQRIAREVLRGEEGEVQYRRFGPGEDVDKITVRYPRARG